MAKKSRKHTHRYHKLSLGYQKVWACSLPDCSHYMPFHMADFVVGKNSICWECDKIFQLSDEALENDKPICLECYNKKHKAHLRDLMDSL